jgi:hypothetical protein
MKEVAQQRQFPLLTLKDDGEGSTENILNQGKKIKDTFHK